MAPEIKNTGPFQRSRRTMSLARRSRFLRLQQIDFVDHQPALLRGKVRGEFLELRDDGARILDRIRVWIRRRDVDQVQQHPRALQMLQEADAKARALGRAFDQAGDIGHDEAAPRAGADHAQVGMQAS